MTIPIKKPSKMKCPGKNKKKLKSLVISIAQKLNRTTFTTTSYKSYNVPRIGRPNTTTLAEGSYRINVTQFKAALNISTRFEAIANVFNFVQPYNTFTIQINKQQYWQFWIQFYQQKKWTLLSTKICNLIKKLYDYE